MQFTSSQIQVNPQHRPSHQSSSNNNINIWFWLLMDPNVSSAACKWKCQVIHHSYPQPSAPLSLSGVTASSTQSSNWPLHIFSIRGRASGRSGCIRCYGRETDRRNKRFRGEGCTQCVSNKVKPSYSCSLARLRCRVDNTPPYIDSWILFYFFSSFLLFRQGSTMHKVWWGIVARQKTNMACMYCFGHATAKY